MRLKDRVALITGAGSGNGKQTALLFAREGAWIVAADLNLPAAEAVCGEIRAAGGRAVGVRCDVTSQSDARAAVECALREFGKLDILVNNAGIGLWGTVETMEPPQWEKVMGVNVTGIFLMSKYAIPAMRTSPGDRSIINIGSGAAVIGCGNSAAYCASKGAVVNLTRAMAVDHGKDGIRVNCVCPGIVDTPFNDAILKDADDPLLARAGQESAAILGRLERPEEVARACLFMASEDASFCTGSVLMADGGVTAQ